MLLTLTSTAPDATDLGFLLHKHPERVQSVELSVGTAHVFYPEADDERCTVALLLEVDPIGLVRSRRFGSDGFALAQYVNDRPYAASSMLAVALGRVFGTALKGRCDARPDLVATPLPLTVRVPALPARGSADARGADLVRRLFGPLGWTVTAVPAPLDPEVPPWGEAPYVDLTLTGTMVLSEALGHLYVLLPVLDGAKHYWVSSDEVDKLVRTGGAWLADHPERDLITARYLAHQRSYVTDALERLAALDDALDLVAEGTAGGQDDVPTDGPVPLARHRRAAVVAALRDVGARRVVDLGCGEGALLRDLLADPAVAEIVGVDVAPRALDAAERRLGLDRLSDAQRARVALRQSSVTYRDPALAGFDAVVLMEVVEHVDPDRLPALEANVFGHARPGAVVVTTPNADYNPRYAALPAGTTRHRDHRFEWSRAEFAAWAGRVGERYGYAVDLRPVGEVDAEVGPPTQLALFTRTGPTSGDGR